MVLERERERERLNSSVDDRVESSFRERERERERRNITEMDRESTRRQAFSVVMPFECAPYY